MMALLSTLSIAPMIDWTYVHFRVLMRILAPQALLYTEMQTVGAIQHNPERALRRHFSEHPLALQLGGADVARLPECARMAEAQGYAEVNLNLGCPSDRVQAGRFGACLMSEPDLVTACIRAMKSAVTIPVTAKIRIGIDNQDSYAFFADFAKRLIDAGCDKIIVHARKAWLSGLSPKQNRTIPPLHYDYVYRLKDAFPYIPIVINGHIQTQEAITHHLRFVDGVMLGRLACQNPYEIALMHHALYPETPLLSREAVFEQYITYLESLDNAVDVGHQLKPILNLTHGLPGARAWREHVVQVQRSGEIKHLRLLQFETDK